MQPGVQGHSLEIVNFQISALIDFDFYLTVGPELAKGLVRVKRGKQGDVKSFSTIDPNT